MATFEWKLLILNRIIALRRFAEPFQDLSNHFKNARADRSGTAGGFSTEIWAPHPIVITVSVDEKPGVQAIGNTSPDLPPVAGKYSTMARDSEYIRFGTWSILAGLDLHDGHVTARVEARHRSVEFIALLKDLDTHYPAECTIRLILDNHSSHISKETRAYLATRPNRFKYVLTPTHGSWLNIVETLFGKMTRTFLRNSGEIEE